MELDKDFLDLGLSSEDVRALEELEGSYKPIFMVLEPIVKGLIKKGYARKTIWKFLRASKGLTMSYGQFLRYVNRSVSKKASWDDRSRPEVRQLARPEDSGKSKRDPQRSFNHNPKAKSLGEYALGKDRKKTEESADEGTVKVELEKSKS